MAPCLAGEVLWRFIMRMPCSARLISIVSLTAACFASCSGKKDAEVVSAPQVPVRLVQVVEEKIPIVVRACGTISSGKQMKLSFKIGGIIDRILIEEGERA